MDSFHLSLVGKEYQGYIFEKCAGKGGMSWVYKARRDGELFAVKVLSSQLRENKHLTQRFHSESRILSRLHHPNIVKFFELIDCEGLPSIAMEWIDGDSLWKRAQIRTKKQLDLPYFFDNIFPLLDAVIYIHDEGIVHRDLKLSNILLSNKEGITTPKLTDFGIAKELEPEVELTTTGIWLGSASYVSPEQIQNSRDVDIRADIYSIGVIMFLMATGRPPFLGAESVKLTSHLRKDPPRPTKLNPKIPLALETIILRCLEKEAEARYPNGRLLREALEVFRLTTLDKADSFEHIITQSIESLLEPETSIEKLLDSQTISKIESFPVISECETQAELLAQKAFVNPEEPHESSFQTTIDGKVPDELSSQREAAYQSLFTSNSYADMAPRYFEIRKGLSILNLEYSLQPIKNNCVYLRVMPDEVIIESKIARFRCSSIQGPQTIAVRERTHSLQVGERCVVNLSGTKLTIVRPDAYSIQLSESYREAERSFERKKDLQLNLKKLEKQS